MIMQSNSIFFLVLFLITHALEAKREITPQPTSCSAAPFAFLKSRFTLEHSQQFFHNPPIVALRNPFIGISVLCYALITCWRWWRLERQKLAHTQQQCRL